MAIEKKLIDPSKIEKKDLPLVVLSDHSSGFIQWVIKWRTKASYNHIMWMHRPGMFASQGNVFSEVSISRYMKKQNRLKFWKIKDAEQIDKNLFRYWINRDLEETSWKRKYDYLGIFGQAIGLKWINNPFSMYCSERVARLIRRYFTWCPAHPSPTELDNLFESNPNDMEVFGYWFGS